MVLRKISGLKSFLFSSGDTVGAKVARGGSWLLILRTSDYLLALVRVFILARLLSPNDFGLFGVALLALGTLNALTVTGLREALIQNRSETEDQKNAVWTIGIVRGLIIAVGLVAFSPLITDFFNAPAATQIIQVLAISVVINGFTNIAAVYYEKDLEFYKYFVCKSAETVMNTAVAITIAAIFQSVWALPIGYIAGVIARTVGTYLVDRYRPYFNWKFSDVKEMIKYGRWVSASSILNYFLSKADSIVVGRVFGAASLGQYELASTTSKTFSLEITNVVGKVIFPAFAQIQDNLSYLRLVFERATQLIALIIFPASIFLAVLAPEFVTVVLGEKWLAIIPLVQVLAFFGLAASFDGPSEKLFNAIGQPRRETMFIVWRLVITGLALLPLVYFYGVIGAALAITIPRILVQVIVVAQALKAVGSGALSYARRLVLPTVGSLIGIGAIYILRPFFTTESIIGFIILLATSGAGYLVSVYFLDRVTGGEIRSLVNQMLGFTKSNDGQ